MKIEVKIIFLQFSPAHFQGVHDTNYFNSDHICAVAKHQNTVVVRSSEQ